MHFIKIFGILSKNIMSKFEKFHLLTMVFTGNPMIYITALERYSWYYFTIMQAVNVHDDSTLLANSQYSASHVPFMSWWNIQHVWTGVSTPAVTFTPRYSDWQISIQAKNTFPDHEHTHNCNHTKRSRGTFPQQRHTTFLFTDLFLCSYCPLNAR